MASLFHNHHGKATYRLFLRTLLLLLIAVSFGSKGHVINIYTEHFPPYNYLENGEMAGVSVQIITEVMDTTGFEYQIQFNPWVRTIAEARRDPNGLIFSIARRPAREKLFQWVAKLVPATQSIFALKQREDIVLNTISDVAKYKVTTEIGDSRELMLKEQGINIDTFIRLSGPDARFKQYELLKKGRADLWPMPDAVAFYIEQQLNESPSRIVKKLELDGDGDYYLAASLDFPSDKLEVIRTVLLEFKQSPQYRELLAQWGLNDNN
jgi:polar amino acid transport system substrate-binding protein